MSRVKRARWFALAIVVGAAGALGVVGGIASAPKASAIGTAVGLGTADSFAILGGQSVTNTGPSVITGNLGVSPGTAITGFPPGIVNGAMHSADAVALQAQTDLTTAYNNAAGQAPDANIAGDLGGLTLAPGVYNASSSIGLTGTLTLDAEGDPNAVFIFQVGSTLTTASASTVALINGASACNVYWQIGSSATLGTNSTFLGNILALTSASLTTGTTVTGRVLARNGSVTLDTNVVNNAPCAAAPPTTTPPTTTSSPTVPPTTTASPTVPPTTTASPTTPPTTTASPTTPTSNASTTPTATTSTSSGVVITGSGGAEVTESNGSASASGDNGNGSGENGTGTGENGTGENGTGTGENGTGENGSGAGNGGVGENGTDNGALTNGGGAAVAEVIPSGHPQTGAGGASRTGSNPTLIGLGAFALAGAAAMLVQGFRRRQVLPASDAKGTGE